MMTSKAMLNDRRALPDYSSKRSCNTPSTRMLDEDPAAAKETCY